MSVMVLAIAVVGTVKLRYRAIVDCEIAEAAVSASRAALTLAETWRGVQGSESFDPVASLSTYLTIAAENDGPAEPGGFTLLGQYRVELDSVNYYSTLSYQDINTDLRMLNVIVSWEQRGTESMVFADADKSFVLTVYAKK